MYVLEMTIENRYRESRTKVVEVETIEEADAVVKKHQPYGDGETCVDGTLYEAVLVKYY